MVRPGVYHHQLFPMEPAVFCKQRFSDVRLDVYDSTAMEQKCGLLFLKQLFSDIMGKSMGIDSLCVLQQLQYVGLAHTSRSH